MAAPVGPKKVHRYTLEFKIQAVRLSLHPEIETQDVAHALDIHPFMLSKWRKDYREGKLKRQVKQLEAKVEARREVRALERKLAARAPGSQARGGSLQQQAGCSPDARACAECSREQALPEGFGRGAPVLCQDRQPAPGQALEVSGHGDGSILSAHSRLDAGAQPDDRSDPARSEEGNRASRSETRTSSGRVHTSRSRGQ